MKATTYIVIDGEEVELDRVSDEKLRELGLESLIEQKTKRDS
jgi:hypothetical protein